MTKCPKHLLYTKDKNKKYGLQVQHSALACNFSTDYELKSILINLYDLIFPVIRLFSCPFPLSTINCTTGT